MKLGVQLSIRQYILRVDLFESGFSNDKALLGIEINFKERFWALTWEDNPVIKGHSILPVGNSAMSLGAPICLKKIWEVQFEDRVCAVEIEMVEFPPPPHNSERRLGSKDDDGQQVALLTLSKTQPPTCFPTPEPTPRPTPRPTPKPTPPKTRPPVPHHSHCVNCWLFKICYCSVIRTVGHIVFAASIATVPECIGLEVGIQAACAAACVVPVVGEAAAVPCEGAAISIEPLCIAYVSAGFVFGMQQWLDMFSC